ncbi:uncharacterized protein [Physcomitrium patens]|uniref:uncharacterized protein isoform X2 n=1 Tax=Physcomitrium patens TaxID=3218 RepID=UPI003CCDD2A6
MSVQLRSTRLKMKGALLRQLQATAVTSPGFVHRLLSSATVTDNRMVVAFNDCGVRGMATGADIMCGSTKEQEKSSEPASESRITSLDLEELVNRPVVSVNPEKVHTVDPTPSTKQVKWWRPDPVTGAWVPEGSEGGITTSTGTTKTHSRITRIRSETTASLEDKRWWTSMEELPDMDRAPLK